MLAAGHPLSGAIEGVIGFWQVLRSSEALVGRMYARLVAGLLAATIGAVFDTAVQRMLAGDRVDEVRRDQAGVIDHAFDLLERGIGDYGSTR
ncbi:hypothetical protein [Amycolatopsis nigrescens]|uniref:hypothetical protein n=1 Tax=Amycolatopsis nigrescens TaxID=381445 RepID=UPI00036739CE|nr:hypothetical protein [Amycolatopsis nigrescens]